MLKSHVHWIAQLYLAVFLRSLTSQQVNAAKPISDEVDLTYIACDWLQ